MARLNEPSAPVETIDACWLPFHTPVTMKNILISGSETSIYTAESGDREVWIFNSKLSRYLVTKKEKGQLDAVTSNSNFGERNISFIDREHRASTAYHSSAT